MIAVKIVTNPPLNGSHLWRQTSRCFLSSLCSNLHICLVQLDQNTARLQILPDSALIILCYAILSKNWFCITVEDFCQKAIPKNNLNRSNQADFVESAHLYFLNYGVKSNRKIARLRIEYKYLSLTPKRFWRFLSLITR